MQGQGSGSNSFPSGNFYSNGYLRSGHRNVVPDALVHDRDGHTSMRWIGQPNSSLDTQNHAGFSHFLGDDFGFSPLGDQVGMNQRSEPTINPFLENNSGITGNGHISTENGSIGSSLFPRREAGSGLLQQQRNLDLNAVVHEGRRSDAGQGNGPYLSLDLFRAGTRTTAGDHDRIQTFGGSSSNPAMTYSGIARYILEENRIRDGLPANGQTRLLCKRKALEYATGGSSSSARQAANSRQPGTNIGQHNVRNYLSAVNSFNSGHSRHGAALPIPSNFYQVPTEVRQADNFGRNTRLRRTASQPVLTSANLQAWNSSNSNVQPTSQCPVTLTSLAPAPVLANPAMQQQTVQVSNSLQAPLPSRYWNGTTMSRVGPSISRYQTLLRQEDNLRNNRRNMMISLANMQANLNLANENSNFIGNVASSSRIQSGPGMHLPYSSIRSPHPNMVEQYRQRLQHISNPSDPWRQGNNNPIHSGASLVVQDMDVSVRDGNPRRAQLPLRLGPRAEGQAGHNYRLSSIEQSQTAAQRSRPISEVRNALGHVRRHGGLRPEVPVILEQMRLDVDNMSNEELQNLEEQIGNFGTGLSKEAILGNLGRQKYQSITMGPPAETEPCCICQEDYANGEELGKLDCGHDFHFSCIKQWLVQKNSCPICKKTALAI
ncbi:hypothetical protein Gogos_015129 [Gossypium gossypioides]|uniref:RING-type E3 ubiquitin transferase n=1 Tax=Gossypium gossypioides TaxID=34282 RepID=A0A7J9C0S3_GOSGO|nr:hypothetical protein [Gossypium gossypioides]